MTTRRAPIPLSALALAAVVGLLGYVTGLATAPRAALVPSASPAAAASDPDPTKPHRPTATPIPSQATPAATLARPTSLPVGAWVHNELPLDETFGMDRIWGLSEGVIGLAHWDAWKFGTLGGDGQWWFWDGPGSIQSYMGGAVIDDRLWFVARVGGIVAEDVTWRLAGTVIDENHDWISFGAATGLDRGLGEDVDGSVAFVDRIAGTWVAGVWLDGNINEGVTDQALRWSRDGVRWRDATVEISDRNEYMFADATDNVMVVVAEEAIVVSRDGQSWRQATMPASFDWARALACSPTTCVLAGAGQSADSPVAWISHDGLQWTESATRLVGANGPGGLRFVVSTDLGFVGMEDSTNRVWASPDGSRWKSFDPIPSDVRAPIEDLAVGGDSVVALEAAYADGVAQGSWVGRLSALFEE